MKRLKNLWLEIIDRMAIIFGAMLLAVLGRDRFHLLAQENGYFPFLARKFAGHRYLVHIVGGHQEIKDSLFNKGRSQASQQIYADATLGGYGTESLATQDQHNPLEQQTRAILLNEIRKAIGEIRKTRTEEIAVVEIGTGNGDVVAYLADEFVNVKFIGIDFDVSNAIEKHKSKNLEFVEGYAIEILSNKNFSADLVFATSTFTVVSPMELERYAQLFFSKSVSWVLLADPISRKYHPDKYPGKVSRHMARGMWGHNYQGYFSEVGYQTEAHRVDVYTGHTRLRNALMQIYVGRMGALDG